MKKSILVLLIVAAIFVFVSCGKTEIIEIKDFEGNTIEVSTQGLSGEQIEALAGVSSGNSNLKVLMRSGLFTQEELAEMGVVPVGGESAPVQGNRMDSDDFSDVDINSLNLDGLTEMQISVFKDMIAGEISLQEAMDDGVFTMQELQQTGLLGDMPQGGQRKPAE